MGVTNQSPENKLLEEARTLADLGEVPGFVEKLMGLGLRNIVDLNKFLMMLNNALVLEGSLTLEQSITLRKILQLLGKGLY